MSETQMMTTGMANMAQSRGNFRMCLQKLLQMAALILTASMPLSVLAETIELQTINYSSLPGNRVKIDLVMSAPAREPISFTTDQPARIALDFADTSSKLDKKSQPVGLGVVQSVTAVQVKDRTRVVLNLAKAVSYETKVEDNHVYVTVAGDDAAMGMASAMRANSAASGSGGLFSIKGVDFRRGPQGEGRIIISLSDSAIPMDIRREGGKVVVEFSNTSLSNDQRQRLDVVDFATPVTLLDIISSGDKARVLITANGMYEHMAYQADRLLTIEIKPVTKAEKDAQKKSEFGYTGEKLSLNFQDIEVRAALQVIADFTGINMVVSDTVKGGISVRLKDVPWDQALDILLKTKGLGMRRVNNVILVAPNQELAAQEKHELESQKQGLELEPLHSEIIQVNYAKAATLSGMLTSKTNSLLSTRGSVTVDERTNTLLVQDTATRLADIRKVVLELDKPVRQVLIESRIVVANDDFSKDLGVRFGATSVGENGNDGIVSLTGTAAGNDTVVSSALSNLRTSGSPFPVSAPALNDRLSVNLPVAKSNAGHIGLAILGKDYLLDLELSALQSEGRGEVISSPRVITANQKEASIEQGVEIPYQEATSSGATSVSFKKAVLSLKVTPQITPDDRVIMDLNVTKDSVGEIFLNVPSINTREVSTQVLVQNGETVVLGGVYEQTRSHEVDKIPFLGDLPIAGGLFRTTRNVDDKVELLIFVTPKIIKEVMGVN